MLDPLLNQKVQKIDSWSHHKQVEDVEPTVDKFEDQKVDKAFFCQILSCPLPPLRRK